MATWNQEWVEKLKSDWEKTRTTPEWRAMEKLEAGIAALKADPEIAVSEVCGDVLDTLQELLQRAWPHHDAKQVFSPMQAHFDGERGKKANTEKHKKKEKERESYCKFLDTQADINDTPRLAARLRKNFAIQTVRGSEDEVRRWKKLRAAGTT